MSAPLRIAHVAPVATSIPPPKSGSVETMTSLLTEGLVARGHDVTLFATADSMTSARLVSIYEHGYWHDPNMWPWELYEMLNLAAVVERASEFDIIHYEAAYYPMSLAFTRLSPTPIVQTLHHSPSAEEVALWSRYPEAPFVAISNEQAQLLSGANVVATVLHGIDTPNFTFRETPDDYLLFLGRFTAGKGVVEAIDVARRLDVRLILAAAENDYYRETISAARRRRSDRLPRRGGLPHQGEAVRRGPRPALSAPGARAVRARACRGDGVRHSRRRARPRRRARNGRRRGDRSRVRRSRSDGRRAAPRVRRSIGGESAIAPSNASAPSAWSMST